MNRGSQKPHLVGPSNWSRTAVYKWILEKSNNPGHNILIGIDFAFALPYCDFSVYFPNFEIDINNVAGLWSFINDACLKAEDFYGGIFYKDPTNPCREYFWYPGRQGAFYKSRHRLTESACLKITSPSSVFKCIGAAQVGPGSLAGMRMLHTFEEHRLEHKIAIWPFDDAESAPITIVEIFPRLFQRLGVCSIYSGYTEDEGDALSSAEALKMLADNISYWQPVSMSRLAKDKEGWIFGVK